jgi:hypothetical protein
LTSVDGAHSHHTPTTNGQAGRREVPNNGCCNYDYADAEGPSPPTTTDGAHQHTVASGGDPETRPMNISVYWIIKY